jgi:hypothetical protein
LEKEALPELQTVLGLQVTGVVAPVDQEIIQILAVSAGMVVLGADIQVFSLTISHKLTHYSFQAEVEAQDSSTVQLHLVMVDMVVDLLEVMLPMLEITRKTGAVMEPQGELKMRVAPLVRHGSMGAVSQNSELQQPALPYKEGTVVIDPMM